MVRGCTPIASASDFFERKGLLPGFHQLPARWSRMLMSSGVSWSACWRSKITFGKEVHPDSASGFDHFAATFLSVATASGFGIAAMSFSR